MSVVGTGCVKTICGREESEFFLFFRTKEWSEDLLVHVFLILLTRKIDAFTFSHSLGTKPKSPALCALAASG